MKSYTNSHFSAAFEEKNKSRQSGQKRVHSFSSTL